MCDPEHGTASAQHNLVLEPTFHKLSKFNTQAAAVPSEVPVPRSTAAGVAHETSLVKMAMTSLAWGAACLLKSDGANYNQQQQDLREEQPEELRGPAIARSCPLPPQNRLE